MTNLSFSRFVESTENRLSKSYFPLGAFNPSEEDYGVLNEVNQENLEKAWQGKITNSNVYIDQVEANWLMQFETRHHATALHLLYSDVLIDAKRIQMKAAEEMGKNPELLKDLSSPEGFELWEATLPALKDHTYNPSKSQKKFNVSKDFNFGDMTTGAMGLLDKLERPVNYKLLRELKDKFKNDPSKAKQEYLSEENNERGVCGYNLYFDPKNLKRSEKTKEEKYLLEDFQTMTKKQAGKVVRQYRSDIQIGLMGQSAKIGDVEVRTKFQKVETGGKPGDLQMYSKDFDSIEVDPDTGKVNVVPGNFYVNEKNHERQHVLDIETIKALIKQKHPSFKHIGIKQANKSRHIPYDKRTGKVFWPSFMPDGFSAPSSSIGNARKSYQDTMGRRQNGGFIAVEIPQIDGIGKYLPNDEELERAERLTPGEKGAKRAGGGEVKYFQGKCHADAISAWMETQLKDDEGECRYGRTDDGKCKGFSGKVPKDVIGNHPSLLAGLKGFGSDLVRVDDAKLDSTYVQNITANRPKVDILNADGTPSGKQKRLTVGKGSRQTTSFGAFQSGNVTKTWPLNPSIEEDAVLLSNIMKNLIVFDLNNKGETLVQSVYNNITKEDDGAWKKEIKGNPEELKTNESKIVNQAEDHLLYYNAGEPNILPFLKGLLQGARDEKGEQADDYILYGLKEDNSDAKRIIEDYEVKSEEGNDSVELKNLFSKAKETARSKARSFISSISQSGLLKRTSDQWLGRGSAERGYQMIGSSEDYTKPSSSEDKYEPSASNMFKAWKETANHFVKIVNDAYDKKELPKFEIDGMPTMEWWNWVLNKLKENLAEADLGFDLEKHSQKIDKMYDNKNGQETFREIVNGIDSKTIERLKELLDQPKRDKPQGAEQQPQQPQQPQQSQQPQQPQQQTGGTYLLGNPISIEPNAPIPDPEEKYGALIQQFPTQQSLYDALQQMATRAKWEEEDDIPSNIHNHPAIQAARGLGWLPNIRKHVEPNKSGSLVSFRDIEQKRTNDHLDVLSTSKDELVSILSESNGEKVFETIKEQLALRKDVCEIIASAELEKQRNNL